MTGPTSSQQKLPLPIRPKGGAVGTVVRLTASGLRTRPSMWWWEIQNRPITAKLRTADQIDGSCSTSAAFNACALNPSGTTMSSTRIVNAIANTPSV